VLKAHDCDELRLNTQLVLDLFLVCLWLCIGNSIGFQGIVSISSSEAFCMSSFARETPLGQAEAGRGYVAICDAATLPDDLASAPYIHVD